MWQNTAMVFQQFNLFHEMTVKENVEFGLLKVKHRKPDEVFDHPKEARTKQFFETLHRE